MLYFLVMVQKCLSATANAFKFRDSAKILNLGSASGNGLKSTSGKTGNDSILLTYKRSAEH